MDLNGECKGGDGFIDRSRVRILLCDNDSTSLGEVFTLLSECSYQVTAVKSARQVIDALNAEGPDIDIILAEIDLPMAKGMKMLRYITRDKDLRRIPVISKLCSLLLFSFYYLFVKLYLLCLSKCF
jgi:pseudo-response regulator 1